MRSHVSEDRRGPKGEVLSKNKSIDFGECRNRQRKVDLFEKCFVRCGRGGFAEVDGGVLSNATEQRSFLGRPRGHKFGFKEQQRSLNGNLSIRMEIEEFADRG